MDMIKLLAGIVPCGGTGQADCTLCDLLAMVDNIIDQSITYIIVPIAVMALAFYAFKLIIAKGDAGTIQESKKALTRILVGILFIIGAWTIIDFIVQGIVNPEILNGPWNQISC